MNPRGRLTWPRPNSERPEVWAGLECTVNRVGDRYFNQSVVSGHQDRPRDIDEFASLGVAAIRYPVLWERVAPHDLADADWSWTDERLGRLRRHGLRPIATLVHHGSGPPWTNLLDPAFAEGLAAFARVAAERYPYIVDWTPINEPLTTARFSALYGHWYPHARDTALFLRALLNECRGIALAMAEIRRVNPLARLVHTEDCGWTYSTPALAYQADHENQRRFLGHDLLCGRVGASHPLWPYLLGCGLEEREIAWFAENPSPPDVIGLNYYVTSDRFLDERMDGYPPEYHGGNSRQRYADVEAVRVAGRGLTGHGPLLRRFWERYQLPLAITEVHLGGPREQQLRWLAEAWQAARDQQASGCDVRAVTAWALLGVRGWNRLVTSEGGLYEPGVFDVRSNTPRPTALAAMVRALSTGETYDHPVLAAPGWWRGAERVRHPRPVGGEDASFNVGPPVLIAGAGRLGRAVRRLCLQRGLHCLLLAREHLDITDERAVAIALDRYAPWAVVNAAGYVNVDEAERQPAPCWQQNALGPAILAGACSKRNIRLVTFSSDLVFDGKGGRPYLESDVPAPLGVYGRTKANAEATVQRLYPAALVVRTAALFDPWEDTNFVGRVLCSLTSRRAVHAAEDVIVSPTYVPDLVEATLDLLVDGERGVWHLCNQGALSWAELARAAARLCELDGQLVRGSSIDDLGLLAPRPGFSVLDSERGRLLRPLEEALAAFAMERWAAPDRDRAA
jgi:dTDP-4-dehydrorhamnose reductase